VIQQLVHLNKLRFLVVVFIPLVAMAVLQIVPKSAMAISGVVEKDLVQITGKSGVLTVPDLTVNDLTGVVAWGDTDGQAPRQAGMQELTDVQLAQVCGAGFSEFTLNTTTGIALMNFPGITVSTFADINSIKMGNSGTTNAPVWDQNWTSVTLGTNNVDLVANGLYIEMGYNPATINNATSRTLNYIKIGTPSLTGSIAAFFQSLSYIGDSGYTPHSTWGSANAPYTFSSSGSTGTNAFYLLLQTGTQKGFWVNWNGVMH